MLARTAPEEVLYTTTFCSLSPVEYPAPLAVAIYCDTTEVEGTPALAVVGKGLAEPTGAPSLVK